MRNEQGTENPSMSVGAEGLHFLCFREEKKEEYVSLRISVSMLWNYILLAQPLRHRNRRSSQRVDSEG